MRPAFDVTGYPDQAALTAAIRNRDVDGGLAIGSAGLSMLTAPAASPAVAQTLSQVAAAIGQQQGRAVTVTEVVPLPAGDPRGAGLASSLLPLVIGAVATVVIAFRFVRRIWVRLAVVLGSAIATGAALAALLHWYGVLDGSWWRDAAALAAVLAAMATGLLGLQSVAGYAGLGVGVVVLILLGNPLSGMTIAPEFLPAFWRTLGSWLPPGAGGQLLRSTAYFDGAGAAQPLLVLTCWFAAGLLLLSLGAAVRRSPRAPLVSRPGR